MAPSPAETATEPTSNVYLNTIGVRLAGGVLALNRFLMTLQNKRMPVAEIKVSGNADGTAITVGLDCPEETARRYATLLESLEDVEEIRFSGAGKGGPQGAPSVHYDGRRFRSVENSSTGEVGPETVFDYRQEDDLVWATYQGGAVRFGILVATADAEGRLDVRYGHVNRVGELMTGECRTTPERLPDGRLRLHEEWRWTSGDSSSGTSVVEEIGE
jgi:hypothetical protein